MPVQERGEPVIEQREDSRREHPQVHRDACLAVERAGPSIRRGGDRVAFAPDAANLFDPLHPAIAINPADRAYHRPVF